jgi:predicted transcriptional regulator
MRGFGDLESVVMHLVWEHDGPVTVRELFDELRSERAIAYTTVMSTMDNLHRKGWLDRVKDGKAYRYTATASREEYSARLMREALDGGGDTEAVLSHFVAQMGGPESEVLRTVVRRLTGGRSMKRDPVSATGSITPQPPGRTPHSASSRASGTTQPQAPLRCPGGEGTPSEASEAPAREAK